VWANKPSSPMEATVSLQRLAPVVPGRLGPTPASGLPFRLPSLPSRDSHLQALGLSRLRHSSNYTHLISVSYAYLFSHFRVDPLHSNRGSLPSG
jgi:hypothetical protein